MKEIKGEPANLGQTLYQSLRRDYCSICLRLHEMCVCVRVRV